MCCKYSRLFGRDCINRPLASPLFLPSHPLPRQLARLLHPLHELGFVELAEEMSLPANVRAMAITIPTVFHNIQVGQNGFLTAALIGGVLEFMERRPAMAGVCLGLLTYKPQFGVLVPVALVERRQTRRGARRDYRRDCGRGQRRSDWSSSRSRTRWPATR